MNIRSAAALLLASVTTGSAQWECQCQPAPPPEEEITSADAVFIGTQLEGGRMRVDRVFKGKIAPEIAMQADSATGLPTSASVDAT